MIIPLLFLLSCSGRDSSDLPSSIESYNEAESTIGSTSFEFEDNFSSPESSWISGASFSSIDGKTGYLKMNTKRGESYIHQDVPVAIWEEFKDASSKGRYYNANLRNKYQLEINE
jgi:hypothetical protein